MADKKIHLKISSAVAIGGKIIVPGKGKKSEVTVDEPLAKNLLSRGRAELLTDDDAAESDLSKSSVADLKAMAVELEIEGSDNMKKPALIAAVEAALGE